MRNPSRWVSLAGLATIGILLAAMACGGDVAPTQAPARATQPAGAVPTSTAVPATPTPRPATAVQAPTATATPVPVKAKFNGNLVVGETLVTPPIFLPSRGLAHYLPMWWGIYEPLIWSPYSAPPVRINKPGTEGIAESWVVATDETTITFKIRKGVFFHKGYGELSARDVCWTFEDDAKAGGRSYTWAGIVVFAESFSCPDDRTVVMKVKPTGLTPNWWGVLSNAAGAQGALIVSKKLYDEKGEEGAATTEAGTGPFESVEWLADDHVSLKPVENHWRNTASVASVKIVNMQEVATRIAALKTGQIHLGMVPAKFIDATKAAIPQSFTQELGIPVPQGFPFAGNYWAEKDLNAGGTDVYRKRPGFKPDRDHPWIGDPADAVSMENARKVRWALDMGFDREQIVKEVQSGLGGPAYTIIGSFPGDVLWKDSWKIPYDPEQAKKLLAEAGYASGFSMKVHVAPGKEWEPEVGQAVAQFWRKLGIAVEVDQTDYAAARPQLVSRSKDIPWMIQLGTGAAPDAWNSSFLQPTAGFSLGFELPNAVSQAADQNRDIKKTTFEQRVKNNQALQDYLTHWHLVTVVTRLPNIALVRPEVTKWTPYAAGPGPNSLDTIVMK